LGTRIDFTAPEARILIVDDIETNLKVVEGLLAPYEMKVHVCASGTEAIRTAREGVYDVIFMDHMMPEMNGIEATAAIRAMEGEYFKAVPIIALTANAVSGMREMFLQNGFNDFLSKPIEIPKLNEIIERWIPREKRANAARNPKPTTPPTETGLVIEGMDTSLGIALTGGTVEGYIKVLETYCRDAEKRLEILSGAPDEAALPIFITQAHALKSASASIGADEISRMAAELEKAGKKGDMGFINAELAAFCENLSCLAGRIRFTLAGYKKGTENGVDSGGSSSAYLETLLRLKDALAAENVGKADALLKELEAMSIGTKTKETLSEVAGLTLTSDFEAAASMIGDLIREGLR
jgi:CheY-like chemotaxis protein